MSLKAAIHARRNARREQQLAHEETQSNAPSENLEPQSNATKYQDLVDAPENRQAEPAIPPASPPTKPDAIANAPNDNTLAIQPEPLPEEGRAEIALETKIEPSKQDELKNTSEDLAAETQTKTQDNIQTSLLPDEPDMEQDNKAQKKGRPRSEKSRKAILKAVNTLLLRSTVQDLSIEAIAKKAKVGKTTIYRWWPNKIAVVMDALINQPGMQTPLPTASNHTEAIEMQLDKLIRLLSSNNGQIIAQLFSEAQADEKSLNIFESNFLGPLTDAIQYSLECGKRDGEFQADLDVQMTVDMLCGPIFFRLMSHPQDLGTKFQYAYPPKALAGIKAT